MPRPANPDPVRRYQLALNARDDAELHTLMSHDAVNITDAYRRAVRFRNWFNERTDPAPDGTPGDEIWLHHADGTTTRVEVLM